MNEQGSYHKMDRDSDTIDFKATLEIQRCLARCQVDQGDHSALLMTPDGVER